MAPTTDAALSQQIGQVSHSKATTTNVSLRARQFKLSKVFLACTVLAAALAVSSRWIRPKPERLPEAMLYQRVEAVSPGNDLPDLCRNFGFEPNASWLDEHDSGYVCWHFHVSDVRYADSEASYFAKLSHGTFQDGFLLYPIEPAGGGMRF